MPCSDEKHSHFAIIEAFYSLLRAENGFCVRIFGQTFNATGGCRIDNLWWDLFLFHKLSFQIYTLELLDVEKQGFKQNDLFRHDSSRAENTFRSYVKMNHITVHGKVTKKAEMKLIDINGEQIPVAVFTVCDIGLPNQNIQPTYFSVNYPKEAASLISQYLVENKEVNVYGMMRQKYVKDASGNRVARYYLRAEMVELLPVFTQLKKETIDEQ